MVSCNHGAEIAAVACYRIPSCVTATRQYGTQLLHQNITREGRAVEPRREEFAPLQLRFVDQIQWRYELIRPVMLFEDRTATQRAQETGTHPDTVRKLTRRVRQQGMLGLLPDTVEVVRQRPGRKVPEAVIQELARLKALSTGFQYRELVRIVWCTCRYRMAVKTMQKLWQQSLPAVQGNLALGDYHSQPDRYQARLQVIKLHAQGWTKRSISQVLRVSRPTIHAWIQRFEAEHFAGLVDKSRAPKVPTQKVWLPLMIEVYHLQKAHPDAGGFRIWSLLGRSDVSVRTVGRIMALNKQVYDDIPHVPKRGKKPLPQPHPYKAAYPHQFWFIDGRRMDFAMNGVKWWSIVILEGYSRTIVAGAMAPTETTWAALLVLYTACLRYGVPETLISDSGGAYTSTDFEAVCTRLQIQHTTIVSTQGESYLNWMETHFNVQRRLYDYQFALTRTPAELEQRHQAFIQTYNTTAHQGLLKDQRLPPIPVEVLGEAKGRRDPQDELTRKFVAAVFPRTTNQYGCVTLHRYHFYVEEGLPKTRVLLWVYGEQLRAMCEDVVLAEYHCHYDGREHKVTTIQHGVFYPTRFASPQGTLIPMNPQACVVLYRPTSPRRPARPRRFTPQLLLFEWVHPA
jgi:transposase InsO family protein